MERQTVGGFRSEKRGWLWQDSLEMDQEEKPSVASKRAGARTIDEALKGKASLPDRLVADKRFSQGFKVNRQVQFDAMKMWIKDPKKALAAAQDEMGHLVVVMPWVGPGPQFLGDTQRMGVFLYGDWRRPGEMAAGMLWVGWKEKHWNISGEQWAAMSTKDKAEWEAKEQLQYVAREFGEYWLETYHPGLHDRLYWGDKDKATFARRLRNLMGEAMDKEQAEAGMKQADEVETVGGLG